MKTISYARMLIELTDLILKEKDPKKRSTLRGQHKELGKKLKALIDKTVPKDTAEYRKATDALEEANKAIKQAKKDIAKVAEVIRKIAKAISLVGKIVDKVM